MVVAWNAVALVTLGAMLAYQVITKVLWHALWEPLRLQRVMAKQGVKGLPFRFLIGHLLEQQAYLQSLPEVVPLDSYAALSPSVTPQYALFFPKFPGQKYFVYAWGTAMRLALRDAEVAKEVFVNNHASLAKTPLEEWLISQVLGKSLLILAGKKWAMERSKITPFFHHDAVKDMVEAMVTGTATEIHKWEQIVAKSGGSAEIDVTADIHKMIGRVLALTAFGGDFETGEKVQKLETELVIELFEMIRDWKFWLIPFYRHLPTKRNRLINQKFAKVDTLVRKVIQGRQEAMRSEKITSFGNDLLGRMLTAASDGWDEDTLQFNLASVLNNSKLFYFAGEETVVNVVSFTMLMLALHPEWQHRAREEILEVLGEEENFSASTLSRLKVMKMILNETMRTFPPVPMIGRVATQDLQLKNMFIPKGMTIEFAAAAAHQDKEYWGDDVAEFNPERFANGVSGACSHPLAFSPFGLGPKSCPGINFAMTEMKIALARVLRRFELLPSPNYKHRPTFDIAPVARPKFGLPLILKAIESWPNLQTPSCDVHTLGRRPPVPKYPVHYCRQIFLNPLSFVFSFWGNFRVTENRCLS